MNKISKVLRSEVVDGFKSEKKYFINNSEKDRKPVKLL